MERRNGEQLPLGYRESPQQDHTAFLQQWSIVPINRGLILSASIFREAGAEQELCFPAQGALPHSTPVHVPHTTRALGWY